MDIFQPITNAECVLPPKRIGGRTYKKRQARRRTRRR